MPRKIKPVKAEVPVQSFEELVQQKVAAGLTLEQAESTARRQLARDAKELASPDGEEDPNPAEA